MSAHCSEPDAGDEIAAGLLLTQCGNRVTGVGFDHGIDTLTAAVAERALQFYASVEWGGDFMRDVGAGAKFRVSNVTLHHV